MRDHRYVLTVPLAKRHSITIISNQEMTIDAWRKLNRYLALQREICADDESTPDRSGEADKTGTGLAEGESGLPEGSSE